MAKMRIIHISDLHLTSDKHSIWGIDTYGQFVKAIAVIQNIPNVDVVVVSGDVADDGDLSTYQYADDMLSSLSLPVLWCPGNHDNINTFNQFAKVSKSAIGMPLIIKGVKIVPLNSVAPDESNPNLNRSRGIISDDNFKYLNGQMLSSKYPTIVVMHHPSHDPGGWMTDKILKNRESFNNLIKTYDNLFLVLYGHIHCHMVHQCFGKTFISAPSVGFAFSKDLAKYQIDNGKEGFLIIDIENKRINVQIVRV